MKKIIAALLTLIMVASLCACATDHSLKYTGVWEDGTTNAVIELQEEGNAVLRLGGEVYELLWDAVSYESVLLSVEVPENAEPQYIPVAENADKTPAEDETPVEDETPAEDEEAGVEEDAGKKETTGKTSLSNRTKKIPLFKLTLSIRGGVMFLVVEDVFKYGTFYCDFSSMMEGFEFKDEKEYTSEFSKRIKSIAFTKQA